MDKAGGYLAHHLYLQLLGLKRRLHIHPHRIRRQAEQVSVIGLRAQGGREQHIALRAGQPWPDKTGGHDIAQVQLRQAPLAVFAQADIKEEMPVEQLRHPVELQRFEVERL